MKIVEIDRNTDIRQSIIDHMNALGWQCASLLGGLGSARNITLRNPGDSHIPPTLLKKTISGPVEVISFTGHVEYGLQHPIFTRDNWYFHVHIGVANRKGRVSGGGFESAIVHISFRMFFEQAELSSPNNEVT